MIQRALREQANLLTEISFAAKKSWNYPDHYFDIWQHELTITPAYIDTNKVFVYSLSGIICGYYSLVTLLQPFFIADLKLPAGIWLDHMFLLPEFQHKGIGTTLCQHLFQASEIHSSGQVEVLADPNAAGFYEKMGFSLQQEVPSSIDGRTTPWMSKYLPSQASN